MKSRRVLLIFLIVGLSLTTRLLASNFLIEHIDDAGWFQHGSFAVFDARAQGLLDGTQSFFWISDPTRTELAQYPPAYPTMVAAIYAVTGERSALAVLRVQWLLDALIVPLLVLGIACTAFGWRAAFAAAFMAALSPLLAFYGVTPSSDAPTLWIVLGATWLLIVAIKRQSWRLGIAAGISLGIACWFRVNPLFLAFFWSLGVLVGVKAAWTRRVAIAATVLVSAFLVVAPITLRNVIVYREFVLTGLNVGTNLWEGLGETEYGRSLGFKYGDGLMVEHERIKMGLPPDFPITPAWPDGIRRDRERATESMAVVAERPVWYAGVMLTRMWYMLKLTGEPGEYYGTPGFNCTANKCLPAEWQGGLAALFTNVVAASQSVYNHIALVLAAIGIFVGFRRHFAVALPLLGTVFYYLVPGTLGHAEIRYMLPMHASLIVFAGLAVAYLIEKIQNRGLSKDRE